MASVRGEGHFLCSSNTEDIFRAAEIRKHQYLKSHYHEQTPFLSLNYKSVNSLIYLLCAWPHFLFFFFFFLEQKVRSFLAGHWYFNSVLIIGREEPTGPRRGDEVSPHRWFSTMSALWHILRSFRDEWNPNETHRPLEAGINNWRARRKRPRSALFGDVTSAGARDYRGHAE